jgi:hypothetical protein
MKLLSQHCRIREKLDFRASHKKLVNTLFPPWNSGDKPQMSFEGL